MKGYPELENLKQRYNIDPFDEDWMRLEGKVVTHCPGEDREEPITVELSITQSVLFKLQEEYYYLTEFGNYWVLLGHCMKHKRIILDSLRWTCESEPFILPLTKEFVENFREKCKAKVSEVTTDLTKIPQRFKLREFKIGEAQVTVK